MNDALVLAVGVAVSPIPIAVVTLMRCYDGFSAR